MSTARVLGRVVPVVAVLMVVLTLVPASVWKAPAIDARYSGFDSNLIVTNAAGGGTVAVSRGAVDVQAPANSAPSVLLATTLLTRLKASLDVTVVDDSAAREPARVGLWSPWTGTGLFVIFGPGPNHLIEVDTLRDVGADTRFFTGTVIDSTPIHIYLPGSPYTVSFDMDRTAGSIAVSVAGAGMDDWSGSVRSRELPGIFSNVQVSLSAFATAGEGAGHVVLGNYSLTLPHEKLWASKVDDPVERVILIALALAGLVLVGIKVGPVLVGMRRGGAGNATPSGAARHLTAKRGGLVLIAVAVYIVGNALLFPLGGHPFDMGAEKLYAYVARAYGPDQLYYLPNAVSLARALGGIPYLETAFPYQPVTAYLSTATGALASLLFAGGRTFSTSDVRLEYLIKAVNVLFGLADAVLIYLFLRRVRVTQRWSLVAAALFLFNPAVWFSMSVWGQTHVMSLFFVLVCVLFAELGRPFWAWLALAAACLTRPQMLAFGLLLGIVLLRKFSWRQNAAALPWAVIVTFLLLVPYTLATSPSLPVDIVLHNLHVQEGTGNTAGLNTVSQTAYSVWPLVTYFREGASGLQRAFVPVSTPLIGSLTYQLVSQVLTLAALLLVSAVLLFRRRAAFEAGGYVPLVALGVCSFLMLLTGLVATHFLLAIPFLLLSRRRLGTAAYLYIVAIWTISCFVPMFGGMGELLTPADYPLLAPAHSAITRFFVGLYSSDQFITVTIVANIWAVLWLGYLALSTGDSPPRGSPAIA